MHQREEGQFVREAGLLLKNRFGIVILDEAHKARTRSGGESGGDFEPNNLLAFMMRNDDVEYLVQEMWLSECLVPDFFRQYNPVLRHVVLRKRQELEEAGLLERVDVTTHPIPDRPALYQYRFAGLGILTNSPFEAAYQKAEEFCRLLAKRTPSSGFMKTLMLQRICSSFASGRKTAQRMLERAITEEEEDAAKDIRHILSGITPAEAGCLKEIVAQLSRPEAVDSKLDTVRWFLTEFRTDGNTWLEHGCIIFSQYYDTAEWIATELAASLPGEPVAVYAGAGKSGLFLDCRHNSAPRESIKAGVKNRDIRLVVATDAACEGLNLQTLGTLINIDLPWNPSRLEQRLGRIRRFGQTRKTVDMLESGVSRNPG